MDDVRSNLQAILQSCDQGFVSPAVALMEMLIETEDETRVATALSGASPTAKSVIAIRALLENNAAGCARVAAMLRSGVDSPPKNGSVEDGVAFCRRLFDWSVQQSEEASVALYSLGSAALLQAATQEIVTVMDAWGVLGQSKRALDLGCGIGRMEEALAGRLGEIHAIDVSSEMIAVARRRCGELRNVSLSTCSGLDLRLFPDDSFDLVFAVDSFPYIVQSGMALVDTFFGEAARVLRPYGEFVVLNWSYRDDISADRSDVRSLAGAHRFDLLVDGASPFALWNGVAFRLRGLTPRGRDHADSVRSIARRP